VELFAEGAAGGGAGNRFLRGGHGRVACEEGPTWGGRKRGLREPSSRTIGNKRIEIHGFENLEVGWRKSKRDGGEAGENDDYFLIRTALAL